MVAEVTAASTLAAAERAELEHQLVALGTRREMLLERRTAAHPDVIDVDERIAAVECGWWPRLTSQRPRPSPLRPQSMLQQSSAGPNRKNCC